ncbi:dTDP-4-dehydrorhamnose reductase [candidate division WOR-3 bacterium]|nr:dTDP-4-dehydrorhamnose reductase [candidate division WOR-3 bacterium]
MLGTDLVDEFRSQKSEVRNQIIPTDIQNLDITSSDSVQKFVDLKPDLIIHLAAYTDVDACELNPHKAKQINSLGTKNVALACQKLDIPILYISTDYIFDGTKPAPYVEWDTPNPINIYGKTKLEGELWVKKLLKKFWIIRTSGLYGKHGKNFVSAIFEKAKKENTIKIVNDQIGSPTYTKDIAYAIQKLIITSKFGIYHITNSGWCSWYEFATTIIKIAGLQRQNTGLKILPITSHYLKRPAKRPRNFRLSNFMWNRIFGKPLRPWEKALNEFIRNNK